MKAPSGTRVFKFIDVITISNRLIVDDLQNTAGDIALSFNNEEIYTIIRNAGIRAGESAMPYCHLFSK
ncbi:hypothetical protein GYMLUDRAFT_37453 [Collybiopsis luxurians FD-317 M1]|nr:hypothetical protein GYMLUDRAFT_37453 [Collybiopsis luxurians FD-317 M1]